jgi:hypothetical protein
MGKGIPSPRLAVEFAGAYLHPSSPDVDAAWLYQSHYDPAVHGYIGRRSRLEMNSRWALARSIRALVAERDVLKEKLDGNFNSATGSGPA